MGLDMYAYVGRPGQRDEFYAQSDLKFDSKTGDWIAPAGGVQQPREIAYWRKNPNLHGWMHNLWNEKGFTGSFNGDELELTWQDLDRLEQDILNNNLPTTSGFFFGDPRDNEYQDQNLNFIRQARAEIFSGLRVFYNSSW